MNFICIACIVLTSLGGALIKHGAQQRPLVKNNIVFSAKIETGVNLRIRNGGTTYISKYIVTSDNKDYTFPALAPGETSDYIHLPNISRAPSFSRNVEDVHSKGIITIAVFFSNQEPSFKITRGNFTYVISDNNNVSPDLKNAFNNPDSINLATVESYSKSISTEIGIIEEK